jgi:hypothetical protein
MASIACMAAGMGASVLLLPALGDAWSGGPLLLLAYLLATLVIGSAGGLSFQGVSLALKGPGGAGGGLIYTMDILGTCAGGWQAGNILIPYLGIHGTLLAAGGVSVLLCLFGIGALHRQALS